MAPAFDSLEEDMAQPELWESELTNLIERLEAIIQDSRRVPWTGHALVEVEPVLALIDHMRRVLPEDIRHARRIVEEEERLLGDARRQADQTLAEVRARVQELTDETVIHREAEAKAQQILEQAERTAREMRQAARAYVDDLLAAAERELSGLVEQIHANRAELRG
jgi:vacuolar-type H+-ATPase subunit H